MSRTVTLAAVIGAGVAAFAWIISGGTFGARCQRMHPSDPVAAERCIYDLQKGLRP